MPHVIWRADTAERGFCMTPPPDTGRFAPAAFITFGFRIGYYTHNFGPNNFIILLRKINYVEMKLRFPCYNSVTKIYKIKHWASGKLFKPRIFSNAVAASTINHISVCNVFMTLLVNDFDIKHWPIKFRI